MHSMSKTIYIKICRQLKKKSILFIEIELRFAGKKYYSRYIINSYLFGIGLRFSDEIFLSL